MEIPTNAEEYVNDQGVEQMWAFKAFHHAETHMNVSGVTLTRVWATRNFIHGLWEQKYSIRHPNELISSLDSRYLKLCKNDVDIYKKFQEDFPDMCVDIIQEAQLKSPEAKERWRAFCNNFKENVDDFNYGTLLRLDCSKDYSDENSILVTRIQFLAIEVARNKQGLNLSMWKAKKNESNDDEQKVKEEQKTDDEKPTDRDSGGT